MKFDFDYWNEKARDHVKGEYVVPKEKCLMGGMLMKRGNSNKTWKSRYFVLYHGLCFYFKSADTKYPIGGFTIFNAKIIPSVAGEGILRIQPECSYSLKNETKLVESRERTFFLQGENEELDSWCLMLHKEKDRIEEAAKRKKEKQVSMQLGRSGNLQRGSAREKDEKSPTEKSPLASPRWVPAEPTIDTKIVISRQLSALKMSPRASSASSDGSKSPRSPRSPQVCRLFAPLFFVVIRCYACAESQQRWIVVCKYGYLCRAGGDVCHPQ